MVPLFRSYMGRFFRFIYFLLVVGGGNTDSRSRFLPRFSVCLDMFEKNYPSYPGLANNDLPDLFPPSWGKKGEKGVKTMFFPLLRGKNPGKGEKPIYIILYINYIFILYYTGCSGTSGQPDTSWKKKPSLSIVPLQGGGMASKQRKKALFRRYFMKNICLCGQ